MPILCGDFNDFLCLTLTWEMIQFDEHISRIETTKACFACFDELTGHAYSLFKQSVAVWWCSSFLGMNMVDKKRCLVRLRCVFFPEFSSTFGDVFSKIEMDGRWRRFLFPSALLSPV